MNVQTGKALRVDESGRHLLDLQTTAEKTLGRVLGCLGAVILFPGLVIIFEILGDSTGFFFKLLRIAAVLFVLGSFNYFRKSVDCYYILDEVGGQLLYHFSAMMMVSEDPVANIENIIGVGATYTGGGRYAVVFCCDDGRIVRVSDFIPLHEANAICEQILGLIDVPVIYADAQKANAIAIENAVMIEKNDQRLISQAAAEKTSSCLGCLFLGPYLFFPVFIVFFIALMVAGGESEEPDLDYYLKNTRKYRAIDINGDPVEYNPNESRMRSPASGKKDE